MATRRAYTLLGMADLVQTGAAAMDESASLAQPDKG